MSRKPSIAAVIMTYNRLALLQTCIAAVRQQTRSVRRIIVVDSASTDGTAEWLATQQDLCVITQPNSGAAGACYTGLAAGLAAGHDWLWCMDDDGIPDAGALEELERQATRHNLQIVGPLVVSIDDPTVLAFGVQGRQRVADIVMQASGPVLHDHADLFSGALIRRDVIERVGNVKREMVIEGVGREFLMRARRHGIPLGVALAARHFHPQTRRTVRKLLNGRLGAVELPLPAHASFFFRNKGFIESTYHGPVAVLRSLAQYTGYFLLSGRGGLADAGRFWRAYLSGVLDCYPPDLCRPVPAPLPLRSGMNGVDTGAMERQ